MTNEEAIKWLVAIEEKYIHGGDVSYDEQRRTALRLARNALSLIKELNEENERLKSVEFTCGFVKPHKALECPIFDEIERTKADTVRELQNRLTREVGTYLSISIIKVSDMFKLIDQIAEEMIGGEKK